MEEYANTMTMYQYMFEGLQSIPKDKNKTILHFLGKKVKIQEMLSRIDRLADAFVSKGIKKGDVVAVNLPNFLSSVIVFYALNKCGAIVNLIHPREPFAKVRKLILGTNTVMFITYEIFYRENQCAFSGLDIPYYVCRVSYDLPFLKKIFYRVLKERSIPSQHKYTALLKNISVHNTGSQFLNDAVYLHSSGTTGESKTIILPNSALNHLAIAINKVKAVDYSKTKCITVLPLFHGFGLGVCLHSMLCHSVDVVMIPRFTPKSFAKMVRKTRATVCAGVPYMFEKMLELKDKDFAGLRTLDSIFVGGDKLTKDLKDRFDNRMHKAGGTAELLEGYGLTESVTVASVNKPKDYKDGCVGYPLYGVEISIIDKNGNKLEPHNKGEICITGTTMMMGYYNENPDTGFININGVRHVRTGDIGYMDEEGRVYFIGREKNIFKIGGLTVFPSEIERSAMQVKGVSTAVATYDQKKITIFVEYNGTGSQQEISEELKCAFKNNLISYARPGNIVFVTEWPRNNIGKIDVEKLTSSKL